jgi:hypothetical protein
MCGTVQTTLNGIGFCNVCSLFLPMFLIRILLGVPLFTALTVSVEVAYSITPVCWLCACHLLHLFLLCRCCLWSRSLALWSYMKYLSSSYCLYEDTSAFSVHMYVASLFHGRKSYYIYVVSCLHRSASMVGLAVWFVCACACRTFDRLCGLLVRVPSYRSRGPGSIPGATRFSEK